MTEIIRIDLNKVNCYLVKGGKGFVLFDTGGPLSMDKKFNNRRNELTRKLEENGVTEDNLNLIVLTHGDCDHTSNAAFLRERFKTKIAIHKGDRNLTEKPTLEGWLANFKFNSAVMKLAAVFLKKPIRKSIQKALDSFTPFKPDVFLTNGDSLSSYGIPAAVLHTPGHTDGSMAVILNGGGLICGDTLANNGKPGPAVNAKDFLQMSESIFKLRSLPSVKTVYPGHGEPFPMELIK